MPCFILYYVVITVPLGHFVFIPNIILIITYYFFKPLDIQVAATFMTITKTLMLALALKK